MILTNVFVVYILPALVLGAIGCIFGALIAICSKKFAVNEDTRIKTITELLPGYNCGGCGSPGCSGFATKIVEKEADPSLCRPIKPDKIEEIKQYMKKCAEEAEKL